MPAPAPVGQQNAERGVVRPLPDHVQRLSHRRAGPGDGLLLLHQLQHPVAEGRYLALIGLLLLAHQVEGILAHQHLLERADGGARLDLQLGQHAVAQRHP